MAHGELWEDTIKKGISESVFFIPIITPTAARSAATKLLCSRPTSGESIARFVLARQRMRFTIGTRVGT
jgi:hypothetical protein